MKKLFAPSTITVGESESLSGVLHENACQHPDWVLFERPVGHNRWNQVTASEFSDEVISVARGFIASGIKPGDRIALMCHTRYEWLLFAYAIWSVNAILVPIYPSSSAEQISTILRSSGTRIVIFENAANVSTYRGATPPESVTEYLVIDEAAEDKLIRRGLRDSSLVKEYQRRQKSRRATDLACTVFTSGTTGTPKGVEITHKALLSETRSLHSCGVSTPTIAPGRRILTFLPLSHVFALAVSLMCVEFGATQECWSDFSTVMTQMKRFRPHLFIGVPRVYEKIYENFQRKILLIGPLGGVLFSGARSVAIRYSRHHDRRYMPANLQFWHRICDALFYRSLREALGGKLMWTVAGGGKVDEELMHFLRGAGVNVYEGYGLTETSAAATVNNPGEWKIGSIGRPLPGVGVAIAEDGEILLKGDIIFRGYWNNKTATKQAFSHGWFQTGDLGFLDRDGFVYITGRKKEIIVTAGGKNVIPGPLETDLCRHRLISQAVVIGDSRKFISCLLTLNQENLEEWLKKKNKDPNMSFDHLSRDEDLRRELEKAVHFTNGMVSRAEGIKKFRILPRELDEDHGELTATGKLKRHAIEERYREIIESMYRSSRHDR